MNIKPMVDNLMLSPGMPGSRVCLGIATFPPKAVKKREKREEKRRRGEQLGAKRNEKKKKKKDKVDHTYSIVNLLGSSHNDKVEEVGILLEVRLFG